MPKSQSRDCHPERSEGSPLRQKEILRCAQNDTRCAQNDNQPVFGIDSKRRDTKVAGVLIGGTSRRMGRSKALLPMPDGRTLLEHVVGTAASVFDQVVLLGNTLNLPEELRTWPRLQDAEPVRGPLSGLCSLLQFAAPGWAILLSCDLPLLSPPILHRLLAAVSTDADVVAFYADSAARSYHPCCALYHTRLLPIALEELQTGKASLHDLLARCRVVALEPTHAEQNALTNVNTPEEFEAALQRAADFCP